MLFCGTVRPAQNNIFDICDNKGVKLLTRLRLGLSHLNIQKFDHGFLDTLNPICSFNTEEEMVSHYFFHCPNLTQQRTHLMNSKRTFSQIYFRQMLICFQQFYYLVIIKSVTT